MGEGGRGWGRVRGEEEEEEKGPGGNMERAGRPNQH